MIFHDIRAASSGTSAEVSMAVTVDATLAEAPQSDSTGWWASLFVACGFMLAGIALPFRQAT